MTETPTRLRALLDLDRCDWCGWPLDPEGKMCRADNCSMRPRPTRDDTELRQEVRALLAAAERVASLECLVSRLLAALQRTRVVDSSWHALLEEARQVSKGCALDVNGRCSADRVAVLEAALHSIIDAPYGFLDPDGECMYCRAKLACIDNEDRQYHSGHKPECQVVLARAALNPNPNPKEPQ